MSETEVVRAEVSTHTAAVTEEDRKAAEEWWNQIDEFRTKERDAAEDAYAELLATKRELAQALDALKHYERTTRYIDCNLEEMPSDLGSISDREYADRMEYSEKCKCQGCWETRYVLSVRRELAEARTEVAGLQNHLLLLPKHGEAPDGAGDRESGSPALRVSE